MAEKSKKSKTLKGKADKENLDNPLLNISNKQGFEIICGNLLENNKMLIFENYKKIDIKKENSHFEIDKINKNTTNIIVCIRYFEYVALAKFDIDYIIPILESELNMKESFDMVKHSLKNKLMMLAPNWENIFEPEISYNAYVKY